MTQAESILIISLTIVLIDMAQFTLVPYDVSSYFFEILCIYLFLRFYERIPTICTALLCFLIIVSTINRESSALTVSILSLMVLLQKGWSKVTFATIFFFAICFLIPYLLLRYFVKEPPGNIMYVNFGAGDLTIFKNQIGVFFCVCLFFISTAICSSRENRILIILFHVASLPYIYTILFHAVIWEVRLYMPLFIGSMFFSRLALENFHYTPSKILRGLLPKTHIPSNTQQGS